MQPRLMPLLREAHGVGRRFVDAGDSEWTCVRSRPIGRELNEIADAEPAALGELPRTEDVRRRCLLRRQRRDCGRCRCTKDEDEKQAGPPTVHSPVYDLVAYGLR